MFKKYSFFFLFFGMYVTQASFFTDCTNYAELKARYKTLALRYHPDKGGNEHMFKAMQKEYENLSQEEQYKKTQESYQNNEQTQNQKDATPKNNFTEQRGKKSCEEKSWFDCKELPCFYIKKIIITTCIGIIGIGSIYYVRQLYKSSMNKSYVENLTTKFQEDVANLSTLKPGAFLQKLEKLQTDFVKNLKHLPYK